MLDIRLSNALDYRSGWTPWSSNFSEVFPAEGSSLVAKMDDHVEKEIECSQPN
jgi:hypothetical protein